MSEFRTIVEGTLRAVGHLLGRINTAILLTLSYCLFLVPVSALRRLFRSPEPRGWQPREQRPPDHFHKRY